MPPKAVVLTAPYKGAYGRYTYGFLNVSDFLAIIDRQKVGYIGTAYVMSRRLAEHRQRHHPVPKVRVLLTASHYGVLGVVTDYPSKRRVECVIELLM